MKIPRPRSQFGRFLAYAKKLGVLKPKSAVKYKKLKKTAREKLIDKVYLKLEEINGN